MANFWLSLLPALGVVGIYLGFALPRLPGRAALIVSLFGALLMWWLPHLLAPVDAAAASLAAMALLAGHAGWWLGRHGRSEPPPVDDESDTAAPSSRLFEMTAASLQLPAAPASQTGPQVTLRDPPAAVPAVGPGARVDAAPAAPPRPPAAAPAAAAAMPAPRSGVAISDLSRTSLGRYRIDRVIGRGSMGVVYQGLDPMLGRQVAIKTMALGREFDGAELDEARQRFFREAETAGRLQHRDIVTIYDVGEEQDLAYIAMEFLKGQDLQRYTSASKLLPLPVVLRIGSRVADALAYAHSRGVVHRDVKPANVMLHLPTGSIKVTDFGIARVTDASRTRTGTVLGTPSFMSPEHLSGQRIDGRSDLYSLGVMLYQLVTGQLPFQADSMAKLMYRIANDPAPDVRSLRPDLPEGLARVLARVLHKSPGERYADGSQMAAELRAIDASQVGTVVAGPVVRPDAAGAAASEAPPDAYAATIRQVR